MKTEGRKRKRRGHQDPRDGDNRRRKRDCKRSLPPLQSFSPGNISKRFIRYEKAMRSAFGSLEAAGEQRQRNLKGVEFKVRRPQLGPRLGVGSHHKIEEYH